MFKKIKCKLIQRQFLEYQDGTLDGFWTDIVERHLENCPYCQKSYEAVLMISQALHDLPRVKCPPDFELNLKLRLIRELQTDKEEKASFFSPILSFKTLAISLIILIAGIFLLIDRIDLEHSSFIAENNFKDQANPSYLLEQLPSMRVDEDLMRNEQAFNYLIDQFDLLNRYNQLPPKMVYNFQNYPYNPYGTRMVDALIQK